MYWISAPTTRRAIWYLSSAVSNTGSSRTMRLCSRAKIVWASVRPMFSFALASPATTARPGSATWVPNRSIAGAFARASARGRNPPGRRSDAPSRSHVARVASEP